MSSIVRPVPPVVKTKRTPSWSANRLATPTMASRSSDTRSWLTSSPARRQSATSAGPETSSPSPRASEVEIVSTAALTPKLIAPVRAGPGPSRTTAAPVVPAARLLHQRELGDLDAPLEALDHVVDRQRSHRRERSARPAVVRPIPQVAPGAQT